jgi:hypothetical protein
VGTSFHHPLARALTYETQSNTPHYHQDWGLRRSNAPSEPARDVIFVGLDEELSENDVSRASRRVGLGTPFDNLHSLWDFSGRNTAP